MPSVAVGDEVEGATGRIRPRRGPQRGHARAADRPGRQPGTAIRVPGRLHLQVAVEQPLPLLLQRERDRRVGGQVHVQSQAIEVDRTDTGALLRQARLGLDDGGERQQLVRRQARGRRRARPGQQRIQAGELRFNQARGGRRGRRVLGKEVGVGRQVAFAAVEDASRAHGLLHQHAVQPRAGRGIARAAATAAHPCRQPVGGVQELDGIEAQFGGQQSRGLLRVQTLGDGHACRRQPGPREQGQQVPHRQPGRHLEQAGLQA